MTCLCHTSNFDCDQGRRCPHGRHPAMTAPINKDVPLVDDDPHPDLWLRFNDAINSSIPRLMYVGLGACLAITLILASSR